jgi:hypothetical protein
VVLSSFGTVRRLWYVGRVVASPSLLKSRIGKEATMMETGSILVVMLGSGEG